MFSELHFLTERNLWLKLFLDLVSFSFEFGLNDDSFFEYNLVRPAP